jgi:hypothetical protein
MRYTMKKYILALLFALAAVFLFPASVRAEIGDMGFFGGISEGRRLPGTTEQLLAQQTSSRNQRTTLRYSELVFLAGRPVQFDGLIDITSGSVGANAVGTYTVQYRVYPSPTAPQGDAVVNRNITYRVNYRTEGNQVIYTYTAQLNNWVETISIGGDAYVLDRNRSHYVISIIEDRTPGVRYYRGDISARLVYFRGADSTTQEYYGSFHGYSSAWSATETFRTDATVTTAGWAMQYQIRPSVTVNKVLQYTANEPTAISFAGNYKEVMQNVAGLRYDIFVNPRFMWDAPQSGGISISSVNTFEQLPAYNLTFLRGNAAEDDITRLFSMQILTGDPRYYQPSQAITRGQFLVAVARAIKLPVEELPTTARARTREIQKQIFSDVDISRPEYPYIMALYNAGIASGRDNGMFYIDYPISRAEAYTFVIVALGLARTLPEPTVVNVFADTASIGGWARPALTEAVQLGIAMPDKNGNFRPNEQLSKGEAANLIMEMLEYMRNGLASDYADRIVNIAR